MKYHEDQKGLQSKQVRRDKDREVSAQSENLMVALYREMVILTCSREADQVEVVTLRPCRG